jgi:hypothetical protein
MSLVPRPLLLIGPFHFGTVERSLHTAALKRPGVTDGAGGLWRRGRSTVQLELVKAERANRSRKIICEIEVAYRAIPSSRAPSCVRNLAPLIHRAGDINRKDGNQDARQAGTHNAYTKKQTDIAHDQKAATMEKMIAAGVISNPLERVNKEVNSAPICR